MTEPNGAQSWIIHQDEALVVVNKPVTIPVQGDKTNDDSCVKIVSQTLGRRIFLINRIDRPVSGLVLMGLRPRIQKAYSNYTIIKKYIAIVHKSDSLKVGTYEHHHTKNAHRKKAYISDDPVQDSKPVTLDIEQVHELDNYTALVISIRSGRFHQIRAQLAHLSAPIKGDVKYGARRANKDRSIMLHAYQYDCHETEQRFVAMPELSPLWEELIKSLDLEKPVQAGSPPA